MAQSSIARLRLWADRGNGRLRFLKNGPQWAVEASRDDAIGFGMSASGPDLEAAATELVERLELMGEELPNE